MLGSMGLACPIALGVALAQPERGVIALEGDGSILMALGCLATIGMVKPRNLTIIIMDNGIYQITGKQAAATASTADIVAIARGAGIANSQWVRDEAHFEQSIVATFRRRRPGAARRQDRRPARRGADRARPAAHPAPLHEGARHRPHQRSGRLTGSIATVTCAMWPRSQLLRASQARRPRATPSQISSMPSKTPISQMAVTGMLAQR